MSRSHDFRDVPVANTFLSRARGLLGSSATASLFIPRCASVHTWFMRHPLDLVFVDDANVVVTIVHDARPWRVFFGGRRAIAVLELPAGTANARDVAAGDHLLLRA